MKNKIVIGTSDKKLFVLCWTEGDTIFLTASLEKAESHKSVESANAYLNRVNQHVSRFVDDDTEREVDKPALKVWEAAFVVVFTEG